MSEDRYSRQVGYLGKASQKAIERSSAVLVGCGALANSASSLLVRMNFRRIRLLDNDVVVESNLPRCVLFESRDIGKQKAKVLEGKLAGIGSDTRIEALTERLTDRNLDLLSGFDVIIDCTDNLESRRLINRFSVKNGVPWVYGALAGDESFVASFRGGRPCFSCLFPEGKSPSPEMECILRVFSPLPALIGSLQAGQAVRIVTGKACFGRLFHLSLSDMKISTSGIRPDPHCSTCGSGRK
jgi:adenylyltransferase/sulfurtransferase